MLVHVEERENGPPHPSCPPWACWGRPRPNTDFLYFQPNVTKRTGSHVIWESIILRGGRGTSLVVQW